MAYSLFLIFLLLRSSIIAAVAGGGGGGGSDSRWRPCIEIKRDLRIPCECAVTVSGALKNVLSVEVNCDRSVLTNDALLRLDDPTIVSFSQKFSGYQQLPAQVMAALPESVESLDLSDNAIHRLSDRLLQPRKNLKELRLANNALGDNLNPIFSSNEFHGLSDLSLLDLRSNGLRGIEEGIFKGCNQLEELYLDFNNLTKPPIDSLKGPKGLRVLSLAGNNIDSIELGAFSSLGETLVNLNLSSNELSRIDDGAFIGMKNLVVLNISHNYIQHLNSDALKGAYNLQQLDMSTNYLETFPTDALQHQKNLKFLNIYYNLITELERAHLTDLNNLQVLDLSYNNIGRLGKNAFTDLTYLIKLDLSFNTLRAIEESSFDGLTNLKWLSLQDNNILITPSAALAQLPSLNHLHLEFNRIAALTSDNLEATAAHLTKLSLTRNLIRELPARFFLHFDRLLSIELSGNAIGSIHPLSFKGVEDSVLHLDLSFNKLSLLEEMPLHKLLSLNLAGNRLAKVSPDVFKQLDRLKYLNISDNPLYGGFPPIFPRSLVTLDMSRTGLQVLPAILLLSSESLESVFVAGNKIQEIGEATFRNLGNLTSIDLSRNDLRLIKNGAFLGLRNLYRLDLSGNKLQVFIGEYFSTGTGLELLDLSNNLLNFISPTAFLIHPRLRSIDLSSNRLSTFDNGLVKSLQFLEHLNLANNRLSVISEFAFSQVAHLQELDLSRNSIEHVDDLAFHNSSQLQRIDLSKNRLESLSERMLEGLYRIGKLSLRDNRLRSLPETIFDASRVRVLEKIDLSGNRFAEIPTRALQKQATNLVELNVARNSLSEIITQDIINSVQNLDISENALSENAIRGILSEAKVLRSLNIASCGIRKLAKLEAPFLKRLNLSGNALEFIEPTALDRTTMLEELDVSRNNITAFYKLSNAFAGSSSSLRDLDISRNDLRVINETSLLGLDHLRSLKMFSLLNCSRIEKRAFKNLSRLRSLQAYDYPKLGYFDIQGVLMNMKKLEVLDLEVKDLSVGNDQLSIRKQPHLKSITLRGERLKNVLSSLLVGVKESRLALGFKNTSIESLPTGLLFPVPRSTQIELDISGSKFKTISPQLLSAFEERNGYIKVQGLNISITCDCQVKHLWRWHRMLRNRRDNSILCSSPKSLAGQSLVNLAEEKLFCGLQESSSSSSSSSSISSSSSSSSTSSEVLFRTDSTESNTININSNQNSRPSTSSEPDIIWTVAPTLQDSRDNHHKQSHDKPFMNTSGGYGNSIDDSLIIGIVGGIVIFVIIILIIIICICRLRCSNVVNEARIRAAMASGIHEASMLRSTSGYSSGKLNQDHPYLNSPYSNSVLGGHANNSGGTIIPTSSMPATPVQMLPLVQTLPIIHSSSSAAGTPQPIYGYYDNSPIYITTSSDGKFD